MRKRILIAAVILVAGVLIWVVTAPFFYSNLMVQRQLKRADAILVLGGSSTYKERTKKAAELFRRGVSERILLTDDGGYAGWSQEEQRNPPFAYLAQQELISNGVSEEKIEILAPEVTGTIYEARVLKTRFEKEGWKSVIVVTSAYHTRRALWTFEEEMSSDDVEIGIYAPKPGDQTPETDFWWMNFKGWKIVVGEYVKLVAYWLFYSN